VFLDDPLETGADVSAGRYVCTTCDYVIAADGPLHLDPCPECHNHHWLAQTGGTPCDEDTDPFYEGDGVSSP
jgi:hypothetical protein